MRDTTQKVPALIDQGEVDGFLVEQLPPELLEAAANAGDYPLELRPALR